MILETKDSCNTITFSWQSSTTRSWDIQVKFPLISLNDEHCLQVMQISCNDYWRPPSGCLQYFTGQYAHVREGSKKSKIKIKKSKNVGIFFKISYFILFFHHKKIFTLGCDFFHFFNLQILIFVIFLTFPKYDW